MDLRNLLGIEDEGSYDIASLWRPRPVEDFLKAPFGVDPAGNPVYLDLKDLTLGGMGPHGLCVGATGSGKSELLRTLILTLTMTHSPERLNFAFIDGWGGVTFNRLKELPHVSACTFNILDDPSIADRLHDAFHGEMTRRQQILQQAGLPTVTEYNRHRDAGAPLPPLPHLLIIVEDFTELLTCEPDFLDLLISICQLGRPLGLHLLLTAQRLIEGKIRGLEVFLSYRIGLRTFSEQESRALLGMPDAYRLPHLSGYGYLRFGTTLLQPFKAAYVSGPYQPATAALSPSRPKERSWLAELDDWTPPPTTVDVVVSRLVKASAPTYRIVQPPLPKALPLDSITGPLEKHPGYGLTTPDANRRGALRIPLGVLDRPKDNKQEPLVLDLSGHLCVLGAPQTGKSTLLRTLVLSAAVTHTPHDIGFSCVDVAGDSLSALASLPHVAAVTGQRDPDRVRRTIMDVAELLHKRERLSAVWGTGVVTADRQVHRDGRLPDIGCLDTVLVIDNYPALRRDFDDLTEVIHHIARRGLGYGIHLVLTAERWADLPGQLQAVIGIRIELRLKDYLDSSINPRKSRRLPYDTPGRCLTQEELIAHIALPRLDGGTKPDATALEAAIAAIANTWNASHPPSGA